jgi:hypothetical protein
VADLVKKLTLGIASGLMRKSITSPSKWSCKYRVMGKPHPGPWSFTWHPWLKPMLDSDALDNVGMKSAQMGFTEAMLNFTFFQIDINGESVLYLMPTADSASDFSTSRFDPALEASPHLNNLFNSVKNVGLKRAGTASLYVRGTRSKTKLKEIPARIIIFDELDEMVQANLPLAYERASGQEDPIKWKISTPTINDFGISNEFESSTKEHYFFKCPHCSRHIELTIDELHVGDATPETSWYFCPSCKTIIEREEKRQALFDTGKFVKSCDSAQGIRGFHINQMYSYTIKPEQLALSCIKAKNSLVEEQELNNSKLGLSFVMKGGQVTQKEIDDCKSEFLNGEEATSTFVTVGIDVGSMLHCAVYQWEFDQNGLDPVLSAHPRLLKAIDLPNFIDAEKLIESYRPKCFVIDCNPERRMAKELCDKYFGLGYMCNFSNNAKNIDIKPSIDTDRLMNIDRSSWLDVVMRRFHKQDIILPGDISSDYEKHVKSLVKILERDANNNVVAKYLTRGNDDHYAFSSLYNEVAMAIGTGSQVVKDIPA